MGIYARGFCWDNEILTEPQVNICTTIADSGSEIIIFHQQDQATLEQLQRIYPHGTLKWQRPAVMPDKEFCFSLCWRGKVCGWSINNEWTFAKRYSVLKDAV
jgi:hypothetical protein